MPPDSDPAGPTSSEFKHAVGLFASGVVLLTVRDAWDEELGTRDDHGLTATAFTSVSLDPPLILVAIAAESYLTEVLERQRQWAVTLLSHAQKHVAGRFAMSGRPGGRILMAGIDHHRGPHSAAIIPDDGLAALECQTSQLVSAGDHLLAIGHVVGVDYSTSSGARDTPTAETRRAALIHFAGRYHRLDT